MKETHVISTRGVHLGCVDSLGPGQRCASIHLQDTALSSELNCFRRVFSTEILNFMLKINQREIEYKNITYLFTSPA